MYTVDIDTGGTMTDCLVTADDGKQHFIKVDTTPHDYTVSFQTCLQEFCNRPRLRGRPDVPREGQSDPVVVDHYDECDCGTSWSKGRADRFRWPSRNSVWEVPFPRG